MNVFHGVTQDHAPEILNLLVEISRGDAVKYEYNHKFGILEVDRVLYGPTHYPVVYCDVPQTWNVDDDDPLDAVVYTTGNIVPGAIVPGRVVGVMYMRDNGEEDHKIICVNHKDHRYDHVQDIHDLLDFEKKDLQTFMEIYKYAQTGPGSVIIPGFAGRDAAYQLVIKAMNDYKEKFGE